MSNAKITHAFLTQEEAIEQVLSPKNPDSSVVEQLSHPVQRDSLKMMGTEHEGFAATAWLLRTPCQNAHKESHFHIFENTDRAFSLRHSKCLVIVCLSSQQEMPRETSEPLQCKSEGFLSHLTLKIKEGYLEAKENARHLAPHNNTPCRSLRVTQSSPGYTESWTCHQVVMQRSASTAEYSTAEATKQSYILNLTLNRKILQTICLIVWFQVHLWALTNTGASQVTLWLRTTLVIWFLLHLFLQKTSCCYQQ